MNRYRKVFFWIFIISGVVWVVVNREYIDNALSKLIYYGSHRLAVASNNIPKDFYKIVAWFLIAAIAYLFWGLSKIYIGYVMIGVIFIYPFYAIFINLFELFLLLMIRHPADREVRRLIDRRRIDEDAIARLGKKMVSFSDKIPYVAESEFLIKQAKNLTKMINARTAYILKLRDQRLQEGIKRLEKLEGIN